MGVHNIHGKVEHERSSGGPIHIQPSHEGLLHKKMGVKEGSKISASSEAKVAARAKKEGDVKLEREAVFAENAKKWKK
jgi:hypothetical protein